MPNDSARLELALAERYTVRHELGRGGMATVYLAEDRKHDRRVAVKVLNPELAAAVGPERFLREIMLTSQLDHPHILPLLDSGAAGDLLYYVMPYVEGETLRERLNREKQLPVDDALQLAREVADALAYAHSRGIVHRDIKPENILLAGGHARVADFGIARAVTTAGGSSLTETGMAVGTPTYMSPEQAAGDQDVDGRSDVYSLACVLYEMLTGEPPHLGTTPQAIFAKRLRDPPPRASVLRETVPARVDAALTRALARAPADRFPTAQAFADRLKGSERAPGEDGRWRRRASLHPWAWVLVAVVAMAGTTVLMLRSGRSPALDAQRVAVIPFDDRTGVPALEGMGELIADWVTGQLARSAVVQVAPAASVRAQWRLATAGAGSEFATIPERLGAGTLVSGVLRVADGRMRIEVEIIDARSGELLDALEPMNAPLDSTSPLVALVADRVVAAVAMRLNPEFQWARLTTLPPSVDAFRAFEAAMTAVGQLRLPEALRGLYRAYAIDSTYLAPLLPAVSVHIMLGQWRQAESLLVALQPRLGALTPVDRAHREYLFGWVYGDLDREYRAAEDLFASSPETFAYQLGLAAVRTNRPARALEAFPHADLATPWMQGLHMYWTFFGAAHHMRGRLRNALQVIEDGRRRHPNVFALAADEIITRAALGQVRIVDSLLARLVTLPAASELAQAMTASEAALEYRAHGYQAAADELLQRTLRRLSSQGPDVIGTRDYQHLLARVHAWSGRADEALPLLDHLARENPTLDQLGLLGTTLGWLGRGDESLAISERLRGFERPYMLGANTLWRARIAAVLGDQAEAVRLLGQAISEGRTYGPWLHRDPDFQTLHSYPPFVELARPRK